MGIRINTAIGYGVYFGGKYKKIKNLPDYYDEELYELKVIDVWRNSLTDAEDMDEFELSYAIKRIESGQEDIDEKIGDYFHCVGYEIQYLGWLIKGYTMPTRHDDLIDYYQYSNMFLNTKEPNQRDGMKALAGAIYPYVGWYHAETHEKLQQNDVMALGRNHSTEKKPILFPWDLYKMGIIYPDVPKTITSIAVAIGLFPNDLEARKIMRPYLAYWWS